MGTSGTCSLLVGKDFPEGRTRAVLQKLLGRTVWPQVQLGLLQAAFWFFLTKNKHGGSGPGGEGLPGMSLWCPLLTQYLASPSSQNRAKEGGFGAEGQYSDIRQLFFLLGFNVLHLETGDKNCAPR